MNNKFKAVLALSVLPLFLLLLLIPSLGAQEVLVKDLHLARAMDAGGSERLVLVLTDSEDQRGYAVMGRFSEDAVKPWREVLETARPIAQDRNLEEHEAIWNDLRPHMRLIQLSAIDSALWDLRAKRAGKPVHALVGEQKREKILVYWSSHLRPRTFEGFLEWARQAAESPAKAVKVFAIHHYDPEEEWPYGGRVDPDEHFRLLKGVREIIGPDVMLLTDLNFGLTFEQAMELGKRIDADPDLNLAYYEEPCAIDLEHYQQLTAELETGISALDIEGHAAHEMRLEWLDANALDMCRFDVRANGGITPALKVLHACRQRPDVVFNLHSHQKEGYHLMAICTEEETGPMEAWNAGEGGYVTVPEEPGMGWGLDLETLVLMEPEA